MSSQIRRAGAEGVEILFGKFRSHQTNFPFDRVSSVHIQFRNHNPSAYEFISPPPFGLTRGNVMFLDVSCNQFVGAIGAPIIYVSSWQGSRKRWKNIQWGFRNLFASTSCLILPQETLFCPYWIILSLLTIRMHWLPWIVFLGTDAHFMITSTQAQLGAYGIFS